MECIINKNLLSYRNVGKIPESGVVEKVLRSQLCPNIALCNVCVLLVFVDRIISNSLAFSCLLHPKNYTSKISMCDCVAGLLLSIKPTCFYNCSYFSLCILKVTLRNKTQTRLWKHQLWPSLLFTLTHSREGWRDELELSPL